jgi:hypothetical protein
VIEAATGEEALQLLQCQAKPGPLIYRHPNAREDRRLDPSRSSSAQRPRPARDLRQRL